MAGAASPGDVVALYSESLGRGALLTAARPWSACARVGARRVAAAGADGRRSCGSSACISLVAPAQKDAAEQEVERCEERSEARLAAERERPRLERDGLAVAQLESCAELGPEGTRLKGLGTAYVPISDAPPSGGPSFGFVFDGGRGEQGPYLAVVAFGDRHPRRAGDPQRLRARAPAPARALPRTGRPPSPARVAAVRAHLLELAGDREAAQARYELAERSTLSVPEQRYLRSRGGAVSAVSARCRGRPRATRRPRSAAPGRRAPRQACRRRAAARPCGSGRGRR